MFDKTFTFSESARFIVRKLEKHKRPLLWMGLAATIGAIVISGSSVTVASAQPNESTTMSTTEANDKPAAMDSATKANTFHEVLKKMGTGEKVDPQLWSTFVAAQNDGITTGPPIGAKVPDFSLPDQNGKTRSLKGLMGPKGLLLVFLRSADW